MLSQHLVFSIVIMLILLNLFQKKNHFLKNIIHTRSDKTYDLVSGYK